MIDLTAKALEIIDGASWYADTNGYEYVTPEMILLMMLGDSDFTEAYEACGGDVRALGDDLIGYNDMYVEKLPKNDPNRHSRFSVAAEFLLQYAAQSAHNSGHKKVHVRHIVRSFWDLDENYATYYMERQGVKRADLLEEMAFVEEEAERIETTKIHSKTTEDSLKSIQVYAPCLNDTLNEVHPLIGRKDELERTMQILCRKEKNNPLHIGEPGVGKTAICYGLVQKLQANDVPDALKGAKVFALDLGGMLAGTQYRGDFEKRLKRVLAEIAKEEKPIIYIDEIHTLTGAGAVGESSFDASNLLKPYLSKGHIRFMGATTFEEYKKYFEKNKGVVRRFQNVEIPEVSEEECLSILEGLKDHYESFHKVSYKGDVLSYMVKMSAKYINERFLPDKAIDLMDEAGAFRKLHPIKNAVQTVDKDVVNEILTSICRVPIETVATEDTQGLKTLSKRLKKRIFGQDEAITQVVNAVKYAKAGLSEDAKPLASLLFAGPTGVGKTEIAKSLSEELGVRLIRFDMSEYGEKHALSKLIGSPAGYVGYEEGGLLTEAVRKSPQAVLLLDEIEKANPDIFHVLLQVMDYATLTDNQGRKADFRNVILIMTSNAGANRIGKSDIGFSTTAADSGAIMEEVKRLFQPEFRNRLDKVVVFNGMDEAMGKKITDKKLKELSNRIMAKGVTLKADAKAKKLLMKKGINTEFGAREIDRVIRNEIKALLVDEILFGSLHDGGAVTVSAKDDAFYIV